MIARRQAAGRRFIATVVALAVASGAGVALADRDGKRDPKGDASPAFTDIRKIGHGHAGRKLRHVVRVADANAATKHLTQLEVRAKRKLHLISATGVIVMREGRAANRAGGVRVRRRANRIVFTFRPGLVGDPRRYRWAATVGSNDTSPGEFDRAPDSGYVVHRRAVPSA